MAPYTYVLTQTPRLNGVEWHPSWGVATYTDRSRGEVPPTVELYAAEDHSWEALVEAHLNATPPPSSAVRPGMLYDYQAEEADRIRAALTAAGRPGDPAPGYLLAWPQGSGKTAIAINALNTVADIRRILVVAPNRDSVPAWRAALDKFGPGPKQWVVITPGQLHRLFAPPLQHTPVPAEERTQHALRRGAPLAEFDVLVIDESQMLCNPYSNRTRLVQRLCTRPPHPRVLYMSGTPITEPKETVYLADLLSYACGGATVPDDPADYARWLHGQGFRLTPGEDGMWRYSDNGPDVRLLRTLLYRSGVGSSATPADIGLTAVQRTVVPIELTAAERQRYDQAWNDFQHAEGEAGADDGDTGEPDEPRSQAMVAALRKLQKASRVKTPHVARFVATLVARGYQVVVCMWFVRSVQDTARATATELHQRGEARGVVEITGKTPDNAARRHAFQTGAACVVVTNSLVAVSYHAAERDIDGRGTDATAAPRATVVVDPLDGGLRLLQAETRAHRDGRQAPTFITVAAGTVEPHRWERSLARAANTMALRGDAQAAEGLDTLAGQVKDHAPAPHTEPAAH